VNVFFSLVPVKMNVVWMFLFLGVTYVARSHQQEMPSSGLSVEGLRRMGSKTNYRVVLADLFPGGFPKKRPSAPWSKICRPIQYNLFARHGHRDLSDSDMEMARDFAAQFKGKYNRSTGAKWFVNYKLPWNITDNKALTKVGKEDMEALGKRVVRFWPDLSLDEKNTYFYTSSANRSYSSAKSFVGGLSSVLGKDSTRFHLNVDNIKTRFYDYCPLYEKSVKDDDTATAEVKKFLDGPEMAAVVRNVKRRLGIEVYNDTMIDKGV
jgi:hypothetical protein